MIIPSRLDRYLVGDQVAGTGKYRLYLCTQESTGRQCLLQIASEMAHNGALQRGAFFLRELKARADELETEYAQTKKNPDHFLNYDLGFPELVDSFVCLEQGKRQINVMAFRGINDISRLVPIINITTKDKRRVDPRTSAWIMGKSLKLLTFVHGVNISVGRMDGGNILIEPDEHYVVIFDWSDARSYAADSSIPNDIRRQDIAQSAKAVITLLGGNVAPGKIPDETPEKYARMIFQLADEVLYDAQIAHQRFYELIDQLWERKFYPFTTLPL